MNMTNLLQGMRDTALAEARAALEFARLQHYGTSDPEENAARLAALYDAMEKCARARGVLPMVSHAEQIARDRYERGFDLAEVLSAFNVLEETLWRHVAEKAAPADYPDAFGLVATVFGAGKQALALQYVALARRTGEAAVDLDAILSGV